MALGMAETRLYAAVPSRVAGRLQRWLAAARARPSPVAFAFAMMLVTFALWASLSHLPSVAREAYDRLREPAVPVRDADLDPLAYFVSTQALALARRTIPPGATYSIVVGNRPSHAAGPGVTTAPSGVRIVFRLWLLPRRYTGRPRQADWVIFYRRPVGGLDVRMARRVKLGPGATLAQVVHR